MNIKNNTIVNKFNLKKLNDDLFDVIFLNLFIFTCGFY